MTTARTIAEARTQLREIANDSASGGEWVDHAAMIARLAEIVELLLPPEEAERDPVPFVDYLPQGCAHIKPCTDIACPSGGVR